MNYFGKFWCAITQKHRFGKPFHEDESAPAVWTKRCRVCGLVREVKRRAKR